MKHIQNEWVEIQLVRHMKTTPIHAYQAWVDPKRLIHWFMTSPRTNQELVVNPVEGGQYKIVDLRQGKRIEVIGTYQTLKQGEQIMQTIQMPELSEQADEIEVYFEARSPELMAMTFYYRAMMPKARRMSHLEYKQQKKAYHDHTAHGFELMFDLLQRELEARDIEHEL
ncbi:SRPBCC domain-containing protein [Staphylococcus lutrae]|uniref:Activator of Hsp90 ATPase homologue 1/2-like C-terminal domain-containing protein n=1 Tax=Staphylococcus lutrae TaxID=155085 RepID=A0AAC9RVE2_9STAP|nr:SRPBCC domain-containing protein [Staphylococcus lutrae]ARJ50482.1 hypothetical protein B5P37_03725 [Staphylococcus lutrae]PNZ38210.1 hypothetical protein CD134_04990 [Staphylococcus lutrae]